MHQNYTSGQHGRFKMFELLRQSNQATLTIEKLSRADARAIDDTVVQTLCDTAAHSLQRGGSADLAQLYVGSRSRLRRVIAALRVGRPSPR